MAAYDEVDLVDMEYVDEDETYYYPCPCGDQFFITIEYLLDYEDMAPCPSCSLLLQVNYDPDEFLESINAEESFVEDEESANDTEAEEIIENSNQKQSNRMENIKVDDEAITSNLEALTISPEDES